MKEYFRNHLVNLIVSGGLVLLALICQLACVLITSEPSSQNLSARWGAGDKYAQLSAFFSDNANMTSEQLATVEASIHTALNEASVTPEAHERVMISAYSTIDQTLVSSEKARGESVRLVAVSGDFFLFHPYELVSGSYFADFNDENHDGLVIDTLVAWKLFGGMDCAGMTVDIGGRAYIVRGVIRADEERFSDTVGEGDATIFVSYDAYKTILGKDATPTIDSYELLIKNPVPGFAYDTLKTALGEDDSNYGLVDNTMRYRLGSRLSRLGGFFTQTMNNKLIVYPYWENRARGYDQIATMFTILQILLIIYPLFCLICLIIKLCQQRKIIKAKIDELIYNARKSYRAKQAKKWLEKEAKKEKIDENSTT